MDQQRNFGTEERTPANTLDAEMKSTALDIDTIQDGLQGSQQIEDGLPETGTPERGG